MRKGYVVLLNAVFEGVVPSVRDSLGKPYVFTTKVEAEHEIADNMMTRFQGFIDGTREFEDAITMEEYITEVAVMRDGSVQTTNGQFIV
jgi:hypothetical protein